LIRAIFLVPRPFIKGVLSGSSDRDVTGAARIPQQIGKRQSILTPQKKTMKTLLVVPLVGLAISFALPTYAQQKDLADPETTQKVFASFKAADEAFNNQDAAALAALFAKDAVLVNDSGPIYGREAIEKWYADVFKNVHFSNHILKHDQYSPHVIGAAGYEVWINGEWTQSVQGKDWGPINQHGYWVSIYVLEDGVLKCRMVTWNVTPPPAAAPSPTASPSNQ
jgi:ketosteroid isomerase-like protein